jgi:ribosomal protein S7
MQSMDAGLVGRYEALGWKNSDSTIIGAQISQILCETGNRAIPSLAKALEANQKDAALKALMMAGDTFEAAIALAKKSNRRVCRAGDYIRDG